MSDESKEAKTYSFPPGGVGSIRFLSAGDSKEFELEALFKGASLRSSLSCPICEAFPESAGKTTLDLQLVALSRSFEPLRLQVRRATENIAEFWLNLAKITRSRKKNRLPRKLKKELKKKGFLNTVPYRRGGVYV